MCIQSSRVCSSCVWSFVDKAQAQARFIKAIEEAGQPGFQYSSVRLCSLLGRNLMSWRKRNIITIITTTVTMIEAVLGMLRTRLVICNVEETTTDTEETIAEVDEMTVVVDEMTVATEEMTAVTEEMMTDTEEMTAVTEETTTDTEDNPFVSLKLNNSLTLCFVDYTFPKKDMFCMMVCLPP